MSKLSEKLNKNWNEVYEETKLNIINFGKQKGDDLDLLSEIEFEMPEDLAVELEGEGIISFCLYSRSDREGTDYWTQVEYYSDKISKTIIFNYDLNDNYENFEEFADEMAKMEADIVDFEKSLFIKN